MSVTNKTIRDLENAAMEAVQAMNELTELLEGGGSVFLRDQRIANRLERLRIASAELDRAETACSRERTLTMSEEDMREEFAALGELHETQRAAELWRWNNPDRWECEVWRPGRPRP